MNPLYFGSGAAPLYGVHHPPLANARDAGVVLCYPFGQEYMRSHRAHRQLSLLLSRQGFHVLRFDYRGTGDSAADMTGVRASDWLDDIDAAIDELREVAGVRRISLVGLRLGALFAAAACERRNDIERLVLWDPVMSGAAYDRELCEAIASQPVVVGDIDRGNSLMADGTLYFNGFDLPGEFRASLAKLRLDAAPAAGAARVLQVVSHETGDFLAIRDAWRKHRDFRYLLVPAPHDWNYVDNFGGILLPQPIIQAIVQWFSSGERA